jgi:hypothetical protein
VIGMPARKQVANKIAMHVPQLPMYAHLCCIQARSWIVAGLFCNSCGGWSQQAPL